MMKFVSVEGNRGTYKAGYGISLTYYSYFKGKSKRAYIFFVSSCNWSEERSCTSLIFGKTRYFEKKELMKNI